MSGPSGKAIWAQARANWNQWAREEFPDDPARARAAAEAAIEALYQRATTDQCISAGIAAARAIPSPRAHRPSSGTQGSRSGAQGPRSGSPAPHRPDLLEPVRSGTVVGYARGVQKTSQFTGGGGSPIQTVEFQLSRPGSDDIWVQMRGMILSGPLSEGHVVEVPSGKKRGGFIQTNRLYNRTAKADVRMKKAVTGTFGMMEAHWGKKWLVLLGVLIVGIVIAGVSVLLLVGRSPWDKPWDNQTPSPSLDAELPGWGPAPGPSWTAPPGNEWTDTPTVTPTATVTPTLTEVSPPSPTTTEPPTTTTEPPTTTTTATTTTRTAPPSTT